jgi:hypothetical protein
MQTRWVGVLAVVAVVVGIAVGLGQARRPRPPARVDPGAPQDSIAQALRQARGDSAARASSGDAEDKSRWVDEVKGFDVSDLTPVRREQFVRFANAQRCTCGCGYTLAGCRAYDPTCPVSQPRVQRLLDSVRAGLYSRAAGAAARP